MIAVDTLRRRAVSQPRKRLLLAAGPEREECIWHADEDRKPAEELAAASEFAGRRLGGAVLRNTAFDGSEWPAETVVDGDLRQCSAEGANLSGADLRNAHFGDASLGQTDFRGSNLEDAVLRDADLEGTNLTDARLHEADLPERDIDRETSFGDVLVYEAELRDAQLPSEKRAAFDATTRTYRNLQYRSRQSGLVDRVEELYVRENDLRRRFAGSSANTRAIRTEGSRLLVGYGFKIKGIPGASVGTLVVSTVLYPLLGGSPKRAANRR